MKLILRFVIALVLTGPVFFGLSRIDPLSFVIAALIVWGAGAILTRARAHRVAAH
jgi:hypothetical protein